MSIKIELSQILQNMPKYKFAALTEKVRLMRKQGNVIIDCGVGDPQDPPPQFVLDHMSKHSKMHSTSGYPNCAGNNDFLQAAANYMQNNYNVSLSPQDEICSTIGSKEAIFHLPTAIINPGDIVICPSPGYPGYYNGTIFAHGQPYLVPLLEENNFLMDIDSIPDDIAKKAKIIWTNYPNSPTGVNASRSWLQRLIHWAHRHNIIIAADEGCYNDIYFDEKPTSILEIEREGIITFYSMSKRNNMTGYRVGFAAGDRRIISGFVNMKNNVDSGTASCIQSAAAEALADNEHVAHMREQYREKRNILLSALEAAGFETPQSHSTFYLWIKAKDGDGMALTEQFLQHNIVVTPGELISHNIGSFNPGKSFIRLAFINPMDEIKQIAKVIEKLK